MTWRGVPRSRAGTIRLSDQDMRDLRRDIDAVSQTAADLGRRLTRAFAPLTDVFRGGDDA